MARLDLNWWTLEFLLGSVHIARPSLNVELCMYMRIVAQLLVCVPRELWTYLCPNWCESLTWCSTVELSVVVALSQWQVSASMQATRRTEAHQPDLFPYYWTVGLWTAKHLLPWHDIMKWMHDDARMISFEYMVHEYVSNCPALPDQSWSHINMHCTL